MLYNICKHARPVLAKDEIMKTYSVGMNSSTGTVKKGKEQKELGTNATQHLSPSWDSCITKHYEQLSIVNVNLFLSSYLLALICGIPWASSYFIISTFKDVHWSTYLVVRSAMMGCFVIVLLSVEGGWTYDAVSASVITTPTTLLG